LIENYNEIGAEIVRDDMLGTNLLNAFLARPVFWYDVEMYDVREIKPGLS
jgi:hypothetical protein